MSTPPARHAPNFWGRAHQCPDAKACEEAFPYSSLSTIINMNVRPRNSPPAQPTQTGPQLYYIGDTSATPATCMHGPNECLGNKEQMCARDLSTTSTDAWYCFVLCQDKSQSKIPSNGESCATECGIDWKKVSTCYKADAAEAALVKSMEHSDEMGINACCTMYMDNKLRCVHDGSWKQCTGGHTTADFIKTVCDAYKGADKPAVCK
jgi:hypothetical protein